MKSIIATTCCAALCSTIFIQPVSAANSTKQEILALQQQTKMMRHELNAMHQQLVRLQHKPSSSAVLVSHHHSVTKAHAATPMKDQTPAWVYTQGTPVTSSPYLGTHTEFNGSHLIVDVSSINEDAKLLSERHKLSSFLSTHAMANVNHPLLELSGKVESQLIWDKPAVGSPSTNADVSNAELDIAADMNPWITGFIGLNYDDAAPNATVSSRRLDNSRLFLRKGFVTIGNFSKSPIYFTAGQQYFSFGRYSSNMISAPFTMVLGRIDGRGFTLGYQSQAKSGPYARIFALAGDSRTQQKRTLNNWGGGFGYALNTNTLSANLGVSAVRNLAESEGIQNTGGAFPGFASPTSNEVLVNTVPAMDVHGSLVMGPWAFLGEYVSATRAFNITNAMFNNKGAKPSALNIEASYAFPTSKPLTLALAYGQTKQSLAFNLPLRRYGIVLNTSLWKNTIESLEFIHNVNYHSGDSASGTGSPVINAASDTSLGKSSDALTAQIGIYF